MLQAQVAPAPEATRTRLIVEPPRAVRQSVLPAEDDERAEAEAAVAGIPPALLSQFGATIRQTHERARVVVIDVPADQQGGLIEALAAIGISARPPNPVQPMLNDPWGQVYLEAMASRTPVMGLNRNGLPEIVDGGRHGFLVDRADPAALAEAILCAVSDPQRLERMATAAQRHVLQNYSWNRVAERIAYS